ncbi:MAG: two-component sensor histidine kinase [Betaproteobacteria bacterium]|nr:two-component sensor histidine kinase [Betaproteobacteria bacterium]
MTVSIRRRLVTALLSTIVIAVLIAAYGSYRLVRAEVDEVFDYHLKQIALSLRDHSPQSRASLPIADDQLDFVIQIFAGDGSSLYVSRPHASLPQRAQPGFSTVDTEDGRWRVYAIHLSDQVVQVTQPTLVRKEAAAAAAMRTVIPFLLLLPLLGVLIWLTVGIGLAQLDRLAREVGARSAVQLEPLSLGGVPEEAKPLIDALNDLLQRLSTALAVQRDFIADAAHELRTPLTALQLHATLIERAATDADRATAIADLKRGLVRASHTVQQLLTLARVEPGGAAPLPFACVDLGHLAGMVAADYMPLAESRGIDLGLCENIADTTVKGDAEALRTLIANLVEHAIRYTPSPGRVDIDVGIRDGKALLSVADSGPGISPDERSRVFDRFYRREESEETGSGLGLAIVRAIADRHGAGIELGESPLGGLTVSVHFPA